MNIGGFDVGAMELLICAMENLKLTNGHVSNDGYLTPVGEALYRQLHSVMLLAVDSPAQEKNFNAAITIARSLIAVLKEAHKVLDRLP